MNSLLQNELRSRFLFRWPNELLQLWRVARKYFRIKWPKKYLCRRKPVNTMIYGYGTDWLTGIWAHLYRQTHRHTHPHSHINSHVVRLCTFCPRTKTFHSHTSDILSLKCTDDWSIRIFSLKIIFYGFFCIVILRYDNYNLIAVFSKLLSQTTAFGKNCIAWPMTVF